MLNNHNNQNSYDRMFFVSLVIYIIQIHVLFAQKVSDGEKLIEEFMKELSIKQLIPDSVIVQYIVSDGTAQSIDKIHKGLDLVRTDFLINKTEKLTEFKIEELTIEMAEADTRYYSLYLENKPSLNFVVWKDKIKSMSSYTESDYYTTIFF